jgi:signal transduction histidine kinase
VVAAPHRDAPPRALTALERLGPGVEIDLVRDAEACIARCRAGEIDLVVCERTLGADCDRILQELRSGGPPVIVVGRARGDEDALEAFRRGAVDFVAAGDGFAEALSVAALEQIRGWRAVRGLEQLQRKVLQTEKLASLGQLAAGVAHEINNPMGFIHANLAQMAEYAADLRRVFERVEELRKAVSHGGLDAVQRASRELSATCEEVDVDFVLCDLAKAIRESQEGSERIRHIVQDLREFSHHDGSQQELADVNQCLDSTAGIVWPMMKHLVRLEKDYAELPLLRCAPMQLKQVFMNLLVNAYQSIEARVGESGDTGRIWLTTRVRDGAVVVSVRDSGVGIAPEHLDRIFDPFFTTKRVGSGTGLGLSTSHAIARSHGGSISVESRLGAGATFEVVLPLEPVGGEAA